MNWNDALQAADSHDIVLNVVNEFLAEQDERFWRRIAEDARPGAVESTHELHRWHHRLVHELKRAKPAPLELQELCVLFLRASVRLHQLDARDSESRTSNDEIGCAPARHTRPRRLS